MNTIISGCFGGVLAVFIKPHLVGTYSFVNRYDVVALCGGFLAGLVAVTGCCDHIEPWGAVIIGCVGALAYILGCKILDKLHIDDPVETAPIYLFGGLWGTIATGIFDN
jgi:Amt family ammonium transporter